MEQDPLIRAALDCGADKAVLIGQGAIVTDTVFRSLCEANRCGAYGMYAFHTLDAPRSRRYVELRVESKFDSVLDTNHECASMNDDELASLLEFVQDDRTHPQLIRKLPMY